MDFHDSVRVMLNQPIEGTCRVCKIITLTNSDYLCYDCWCKLNPIGDNE